MVNFVPFSSNVKRRKTKGRKNNVKSIKTKKVLALLPTSFMHWH